MHGTSWAHSSYAASFAITSAQGTCSSAIMSCPLLFCRRWFLPSPCFSTHCFFCQRFLWLYPLCCNVQLTFQREPGYYLFFKGSYTHPRCSQALLNSLGKRANRLALTGYVLSLSFVISRESPSTLYPSSSREDKPRFLQTVPSSSSIRLWNDVHFSSSLVTIQNGCPGAWWLSWLGIWLLFWAQSWS